MPPSIPTSVQLAVYLHLREGNNTHTLDAAQQMTGLKATKQIFQSIYPSTVSVTHCASLSVKKMKS